VELDNALRGADGKGPGLKMFQAPPDWQEKSEVLAGLPCALVSGDQGGDLWTAENLMDSDLGRLNYVQEPDVFNHGIHNDLVGTSLDLGFGPLMYALQVAVNLPFLPFRDGRFGRMIKECTEKLQARRQQMPDRPDEVFKFWYMPIAALSM